MPELPEVETIRLRLIPLITGKKIKEVKVLVLKQFIGNKASLVGRKIVDIKRTGKVFNLILDNEQILNIHLKMTGQLLFAKNKNEAEFDTIIPFANSNKMPGKTTRIIMEFSDNSILFFNDLRKFGWFKVTNIPEGPKAIDVLSKKFTPQFLTDLTDSTNRPIKQLLMDQEKISGIGNIYANDALFIAGIHPLRTAASMNNKEIKKLHEGIITVIEQGLKDQGSSGADEAFILPDGKKGTHQRHFLVYQRERLPCIKCKSMIKRIKQNGRSSFFCPICQRR